ncbi:MAG: VOC family protein [Armatimonadota bacterium]
MANGPPDISGVHHIGILVRDARAAAERLEALGLEVTAWEDYGPGLLRIGFIPLGGTLLELIEPLTSDGFNADWLRDRGEGIQHIALRVDDIQAALEALKARGVALQDEAPRAGAGDTLIAFLAPGPAGGVLVELTQPVKPA